MLRQLLREIVAYVDSDAFVEAMKDVWAIIWPAVVFISPFAVFGLLRSISEQAIIAIVTMCMWVAPPLLFIAILIGFHTIGGHR